MKVLIDTSPLANAHAIRGIGIYTKYLSGYLEKLANLKLKRSTLIKDEKFDPDIIHYPYFDLFFNTLPLRLNKRKKIVVTVHDVIPLKFPEQYNPGIKGKLKFLKQKKTIQKVDAIITDSYASKIDIVNYLNISDKKIHVVYLAANPKIKKPSNTIINQIKKKYKLPQKFILYVGDINYNKNIVQLIKAVKYLPNDIKLVCVGKNFKAANIPEWQWIETQLVASQVEKRVKFISNILGDADEELSAIYAAAEIYVQASIYEGFGLPVLEAMICKTPVICSKNSSLIEIGDGFVQFTREDAESIANNIKKVLAWPKQKRETFIKKAFTWSKKFTWQKTAKNTFKVYQKIL
ncbi:MAG: glycosyltransferase family 1 protein [Candidatus Woesebacteria bacterium]|jgi:glycosyltransferase involved in cell wall biosynthesis